MNKQNTFDCSPTIQPLTWIVTPLTEAKQYSDKDKKSHFIACLRQKESTFQKEDVPFWAWWPTQGIFFQKHWWPTIMERLLALEPPLFKERHLQGEDRKNYTERMTEKASFTLVFPQIFSSSTKSFLFLLPLQISKSICITNPSA